MSEKIITTNRAAYHDYHIQETYEAGIALTGTEVKGIVGQQGGLHGAHMLRVDAVTQRQLGWETIVQALLRLAVVLRIRHAQGVCQLGEKGLLIHHVGVQHRLDQRLALVRGIVQGMSELRLVTAASILGCGKEDVRKRGGCHADGGGFRTQNSGRSCA